MASKSTVNYQLALPQETDYVLVEELDNNFVKLDEVVSKNENDIKKLQNMDKIYVAEYGKTTYSEIVAQKNQNKKIILTGQFSSEGTIQVASALLTYIDSTKAVFSQPMSSPEWRIREYRCLASGTWEREFIRTQNTKNKITSITTNSTNDQYPSAKAVYDALDAKVFERTVKTANTWSKDTNNVYYQNVTVNDVKTTDKIIIDVDMSQAIQKVSGQTLLDNYALIGRAYVLSTNTIKLCCYDAAPTAVVALKVLVIR